MTTMSLMSPGGQRKVHYTFPEESEMVEEYDLQTDEMLVRKRCSKTVPLCWVRRVTGRTRWASRHDATDDANATNPVFTRKDRVNAFEWRVRNLPYPKNTCSVTITSSNASWWCARPTRSTSNG